MGSEHYCLRWNNHQSNLLGVFSQLLQDETLVDVTLACEGHSLRAHKVVLSACSSFFRSLFVNHPDRHPIVILKDVKFCEMKALLEFMYKGEVNIEYSQLSVLLHTAESLKVKGLAEMAPQDPGGRVVSLGQVGTPTSGDKRSREGSPGPSPQSKRGRSRHPSGASSDRPESPESAVIEEQNTEPPVPPSPPIIVNEPVPGPSGIQLPVQEAPLSLKKEVDWDRAPEERSTGDSSSEYRHLHDSNRSPEMVKFKDEDLESDRGMSADSGLPTGSGIAMESGMSVDGGLPTTAIHYPFSLGIADSLKDGSSLAGLLHPELLPLAVPNLLGPLGAGAYRCHICLAMFPTEAMMEQHTSLHAREKPYKCDQCGQCYKYQSAYAKHCEQNHMARLPAEKPFCCDMCGMQFKYLKSFKKHRLNHTLDRLRCKSTSTPGPENGMGFTMECDANGVPFGNANESREVEDTGRDSDSSDRLEINMTEELPLANNNGDVGLGNSHANLAHVSEVEDVDGSSGVPSVASSPENGFTTLLNQTDDVNKRNFICAFCPKTFRTKENLKLHLRKHTGERPFECEFCGRAFGGKSDMNRHLRIHTGERPYHCEVCGKSFARADYLSKHLTTHMNN